MSKYTVIHTIRFSEKQAETLQKLKDYDVNISKFIRLAIAEKIKRGLEANKREKRTGETPVLIKNQNYETKIKNRHTSEIKADTLYL